jgi:hypothetical protein
MPLQVEPRGRILDGGALEIELPGNPTDETWEPGLGQGVVGGMVPVKSRVLEWHRFLESIMEI